MSTANNPEDPFEVEALVISAGRQILTKAGFKDPLTPGSEDEIADDFTALRFGLAEATGVLGQQNVGGRVVTDHAEYRGNFEIDLAVPRTENILKGGVNGQGVSRVMDKKMAKLRYRFRNHPPPFRGFLPFWQVTAIVPQITQYDLRRDREVDFATLSWELTLKLLADALPAQP